MLPEIKKMPKSNPEWANVLTNILSTEKPRLKNSIILSLAEKLDEKNDSEDSDEKQNSSKVANKALIKKHWISRGRCKPSPYEDGEREKKLRRIAVAGVVQLFNTVGKCQKGTKSSTASSASAAPPVSKFKKLDKKTFVNVLLGQNDVKTEENIINERVSMEKEIKEDENEQKTEDENEPTSHQWDVLRNDFMMSAKLKDWDKQIDT